MIDLPVISDKSNTHVEHEVRYPSRKSRRVYIGNVAVGGGAPISVQTMTKTKTSDIDATVKQIIEQAKYPARR